MVNIFISELFRRFVLFIRYPVENSLDIVTRVAFFYCLFAGVSHFSSPGIKFNQQVDGMIIGYMVWFLASSGLDILAREIEQNAVDGTLESLFLSGYDVTMIFIMRALAGICEMLLFTLVIMFALIMLTGSTMALHTSVLLPFILILISTLGLGMMCASCSLILKRTGSIIRIMQYGLLLLFMTPFESWSQNFMSFSLCLPVVPGAVVLKSMMVHRASPDSLMVLYSAINAGIYFFSGWFFLKVSVRLAKNRGLLSGY